MTYTKETFQPLDHLPPVVTIYEYENILKPLLSRAGFKRYSSEYHNRIYDDYVKLYLLIIKSKYNLSYRGTVKFIKQTGLHRKLGLKKILHYTTLQKFEERIGEDTLRRIVQEFEKALREKIKSGEIIIVDSTGFEEVYSSFYYEKRIQREGKRKKFVKTSIAVEYKSRLVLDVYAEEGHKHDIKMLEEHLRVLDLNKWKYFIGDKAYDSYKLREFLKSKGISFIVPRREYGESGYSPLYEGGRKRLEELRRRREERDREFDPFLYSKRNIVESVFSSIKRRMGGFVRSVKGKNKVKEVYLKVIVYNLEIAEKNLRGKGVSIRFFVLVILEGFY